jgi:hypothetical protein
MPTLQIQGEYSVELISDSPAIRRGMAAGHHGNDLPEAEERLWKLTFRGLPNATAQSIVDVEDSVSRTPALYVWFFVRRRLQDGQPFQMCDPETETTVTVKLAQDSLQMTMFAQYLWSTSFIVEEFE